MKNFKLNQSEINYLLSADFLSPEIKKIINHQKQKGDILALDEEKADEIRDLLGEQLQINGFDENYELTNEGEIIVCLIDKLFIG